MYSHQGEAGQAALAADGSPFYAVKYIRSNVWMGRLQRCSKIA